MAEAYMNDPEFDDAPTGRNRPPMSEDSQEVVMLRDVANQLRLLRNEQISMRGGKPGKPDFLMPPYSALEAAEERIKKKKHLSIVHAMLPHKRAETEEKLKAIDES